MPDTGHHSQFHTTVFVELEGRKRVVQYQQHRSRKKSRWEVQVSINILALFSSVCFNTMTTAVTSDWSWFTLDQSEVTAGMHVGLRAEFCPLHRQPFRSLNLDHRT